jgi:hypothetical protein
MTPFVVLWTLLSSDGGGIASDSNTIPCNRVSESAGWLTDSDEAPLNRGFVVQGLDRAGTQGLIWAVSWTESGGLEEQLAVDDFEAMTAPNRPKRSSDSANRSKFGEHSKSSWRENQRSQRPVRCRDQRLLGTAGSRCFPNSKRPVRGASDRSRMRRFRVSCAGVLASAQTLDGPGVYSAQSRLIFLLHQC